MLGGALLNPHMSFLSVTPLNDMQGGWMSTGHCDTRGDPRPAKMDQLLYGSKMLMGAQGHRVHLSCPVLKWNLFKQLCTKTVNQRIQLQYCKKTLWEFITELFQHTSFNSVLFFNIKDYEIKCPRDVFTCSTKAVDIKETAVKARIKSGSVVLFPGYTLEKLQPSFNQSIGL